MVGTIRIPIDVWDHIATPTPVFVGLGDSTETQIPHSATLETTPLSGSPHDWDREINVCQAVHCIFSQNSGASTVVGVVSLARWEVVWVRREVRVGVRRIDRPHQGREIGDFAGPDENGSIDPEKRSQQLRRE